MSRESLIRKRWPVRTLLGSLGRDHRDGETATPAPLPARFHDQGHLRRFWAHYLRIGIFVFTGEALAVLVYLVLTLGEPNRGLLVALTSIAILASVASMPFTGHLATMSWRTRYSFAWTLFAGFVLAVSVHLDRGIDSPLIFLLALPIVSAALALEVRQVIVCGAATLGEFTYIWMYDGDVHRSASVVVMFAMALVGLVVIAVGVSTARSRLLEDEVELRTELSNLATIDTLTGCLNHGAFYERLEIEINRALRQNEPLSLLMIDLDFFKAFNDTYGHLAGDDALRNVGRTLMNTSRGFDAVGRIGGDEFAVILPTSSFDDASRIAARMSVAAATAGRPTVSVGYAALDPAHPSATELVRAADESLYDVKFNGSGRTPTSQPAVRSVRGEAPSAGKDARRRLVEERVRAADRATHDALTILERYQSTSIVGMGFVDRDFRFVRVNPMLASVHGGVASEQIGRTIAEVVPKLWPQLEPMYRFVVDTNSPIANREVTGQSPAEPGITHRWLTNLYPVTIENEVIGVGIVLVDVTNWDRTFVGQELVDHSIHL
jgi:diguanylate cyclase (GGDEF)-like protein